MDEDKRKMKRYAHWLILSCILVATLIHLSYISTVKEEEEVVFPQSADEVSGLTVQDEAAIYARVIMRLATVDNKLGEDHNPEILYIVNKKININSKSANWPVISEILQKEISSKISDLSKERVWIDFEDWPNYSKKTDGAIITLGDVSPQAGESVQVWGSIYPANRAGGSILYVLGKVGVDWDIIRTAGAGSS